MDAGGAVDGFGIDGDIFKFGFDTGKNAASGSGRRGSGDVQEYQKPIQLRSACH